MYDVTPPPGYVPRTSLKGTLLDPENLANLQQVALKPPPAKPAFDVQKFLAEHFDGKPVQLPTEEEELAQELEQERQRMEAKRANCGKHGIRVRAKDGKWKRIKYHCGLWRDGFCPRCYTRRMTDMKERYLRAVGKCQEPKACIMDQDEATKFIRRLKDSDVEYDRYPTKEGDIVLFDSATYRDFEYDQVSLDDLDFDLIADSPGKRRYSGTLGTDETPVTSEKDSNAISVKVDVVIAKPGEGHKLSEAWQEALEKTKDLDPDFDVDEIEIACKQRIGAYCNAILQQGGQILLKSKAIEVVSPNSLSWKGDSELGNNQDWVLDLENDQETPDWIQR